MMQFQPVSTWGLNTGTFHPISSLIIHADSSLISQYGELPQGASETPHLQIFSPSSSSSIPLLSADGDDDGEKRDTNDTARIASGVMHSLLSAFGVSFNLMVLMINWLECRPSRRTGAPTMVNISLLAVCDLLYSLMSAYYAVASFLGDHNFLGVWSCRMNGLDITLMHINIWSTLAIGLQRKAAIQSGNNYRFIFTLKTTLLLQLVVWGSAMLLGSYFLYNFDYDYETQTCSFQASSFSFNMFIILVYLLCYLVPVLSIASYYKTFGQYFREQIRTSRRRATFNCPRSAHQRFMDDRNKFLHFYSYATAISVFVCYTPFFNYRLLVALDVMLFHQTIIQATASWLPIVEGVAIAICALNSVANPFFYVLLKHTISPNMAVAYQHHIPRLPLGPPIHSNQSNSNGNKKDSSMCLRFDPTPPDQWPPAPSGSTRANSSRHPLYPSQRKSKATTGGCMGIVKGKTANKNKDQVFYTVTVQKTGRLYRSEVMLNLSDV